jgi:hypothetical protein
MGFLTGLASARLVASCTAALPTSAGSRSSLLSTTTAFTIHIQDNSVSGFRAGRSVEMWRAAAASRPTGDQRITTNAGNGG